MATENVVGVITHDTVTGLFAWNSITIATATVYDAAHARWGFGTASPTTDVDVTSASSGTTKISVNNTNAAGGASVQMLNSNADNIEFVQFGRSAGSTYFGVARAGLAVLGGSPNSGMAVGTRTATPLILAVNDTEYVRILSTGLMGVQTTAPLGVLQIGTYNSAATRNALVLAADAPRMYFHEGSDCWKIAAQDTINHGWTLAYGTVNADPTASTYTDALTVMNTGTVRFNAYGAGTLTTDASGNITATSDAILKNVLGDYTTGLAAILGLRPKRFRWKKESGLDTENDYAGFLAQEVRPYIPEAVLENKSGVSGFQDRPIIAALVNAVKELAARVVALEKKPK